MGFRIVENKITPALKKLMFGMSSEQISVALSPLLSAEIQRNIQTQGKRIGATWPELADVTKVARRKFAPGAKMMMLVDTSQLKNSVNTVRKFISVDKAVMSIVASRISQETGRDIAYDLHHGVGAKTPGKTGYDLSDPDVVKRLQAVAEELKKKEPTNIPARPYMTIGDTAKKLIINEIIRIWSRSK